MRERREEHSQTPLGIIPGEHFREVEKLAENQFRSILTFTRARMIHENENGSYRKYTYVRDCVLLLHVKLRDARDI